MTKNSDDGSNHVMSHKRHSSEYVASKYAVLSMSANQTCSDYGNELASTRSSFEPLLDEKNDHKKIKTLAACQIKNKEISASQNLIKSDKRVPVRLNFKTNELINIATHRLSSNLVMVDSDLSVDNFVEEVHDSMGLP